MVLSIQKHSWDVGRQKIKREVLARFELATFCV